MTANVSSRLQIYLYSYYPVLLQPLPQQTPTEKQITTINSCYCYCYKLTITTVTTITILATDTVITTVTTTTN